MVQGLWVSRTGKYRVRSFRTLVKKAHQCVLLVHDLPWLRNICYCVWLYNHVYCPDESSCHGCSHGYCRSWCRGGTHTHYWILFALTSTHINIRQCKQQLLLLKLVLRGRTWLWFLQLGMHVSCFLCYSERHSVNANYCSFLSISS